MKLLSWLREQKALAESEVHVQPGDRRVFLLLDARHMGQAEAFDRVIDFIETSRREAAERTRRVENETR